MDLASLFGLLAVFVLIAINGFFVAAEFALVKVRATRIEQLVNEGKKSARVAQQQIEHWIPQSRQPSWGLHWPAWLWAGLANHRWPISSSRCSPGLVGQQQLPCRTR